MAIIIGKYDTRSPDKCPRDDWNSTEFVRKDHNCRVWYASCLIRKLLRTRNHKLAIQSRICKAHVGLAQKTTLLSSEIHRQDPIISHFHSHQTQGLKRKSSMMVDDEEAENPRCRKKMQAERERFKNFRLQVIPRTIVPSAHTPVISAIMELLRKIRLDFIFDN